MWALSASRGRPSPGRSKSWGETRAISNHLKTGAHSQTNVRAFLYELRSRRVPVGTTEAVALAKAVEHGLHESSLDGFYFVARSLTVHDEKHLDAFGQAFAKFFLQGIDAKQRLPDLTPEEKALLESLDEKTPAARRRGQYRRPSRSTPPSCRRRAHRTTAWASGAGWRDTGLEARVPESPGELAPRAVLADALIEVGETFVQYRNGSSGDTMGFFLVP